MNNIQNNILSSIDEVNTSEKTTVNEEDEEGNRGKTSSDNEVEVIQSQQEFDVEQKLKDDEETMEYSTFKKVVIFIIVTALPTITQMASTALFPTFPFIRDSLSTTETVTNAIAASHTLITGFVPVLWASYSNIYGRQPIYLLSSFILIVGHVGSALSVNIEMLIVFRTIAGIGGGVGRTASVGTITEVFSDNSKGKALGLNSALPLASIAIGPIVGGVLTQYFGWRSVFWTFAICYGVLLVFIIFLLPETNKKVIEAKKQRRLQKQAAFPVGQKEKQHNNSASSQNFLLINPFSSLLILLKYPNILLCSIYIGLITFVGYATTISFTWVYSSGLYHFNSIQVGLCFIPGALGSIVGAFTAGALSDRKYKNRVEKAKKCHSEIYPEMRLSLSLLGPVAFIMVGYSIAYGWCIEKQLHFAYGIIVQMFGQFSALLCVCILIIYAVQCIPEEGASIQACFEMVRSIFTFTSILATIDLERLAGYGVLYTVYGFILLFGSVCIIYIQKNRVRWRARISRP